MYWNLDPDVMTYEEVKELAGELLAEYCKDYKTYKLKPKSVRTVSRLSKGENFLANVNSFPLSNNKRYCGVCVCLISVRLQLTTKLFPKYAWQGAALTK